MKLLQWSITVTKLRDFKKLLFQKGMSFIIPNRNFLKKRIFLDIKVFINLVTTN